MRAEIPSKDRAHWIDFEPPGGDRRFYPLGLHMKRAEVLLLAGRWDEVEGIYRDNLMAAEEAGSMVLSAECRNRLGTILHRKGGIAEARRHYDLALEAFRQANDLQGQTNVLGCLGLLHAFMGELDEAMDCYRSSLELAERTGHRQSIANIHSNMANILIQQGDTAGAREHISRKLEISEAIGDQAGVSIALGSLGISHSMDGDNEKALDCMRRQLGIARMMGDRLSVAYCVGNMGIVHDDQGDCAKALECHRTQLDICREIGDRKGLVLALENAGSVLVNMGRHREAAAALEEAAGLAGLMGALQIRANVLWLMARARQGMGDPAGAVASTKEAEDTAIRAGDGGLAEKCRRLLDGIGQKPQGGAEVRTNNRAILVGLCRDAREARAEEESLEELARLADTAGARVIDVVLQRRPRPDPAHFIGKGKAQELSEGAARAGAGLVVFDHNLSPSQAHNLGKLLGCRVLDRAELIMDIFALHARSAEARIQVELAQLQYRFSRLVGAGLEMTDPGAGIGTRGPGEKQLELDRRKIRHRLARLRQDLKRIETQRRTQRKARASMFRAALVGYTNAGKSSLMNLISKSGLKVADRLFATLDPATRLTVTPSGHKFLLTDTVGFVRRLPHQLVASFRSTLEEAVEADLVLHVVDCAHPARERQMQAVRQVLQEIGVTAPELTVYNKADLAEERLLEELRGRDPGACLVSALTGAGRRELEAEIEARMEGKA